MIVPVPRSRWFSPPSTPAATRYISSFASSWCPGVTGTDDRLDHVGAGEHEHALGEREVARAGGALARWPSRP